VQRLAIIADDDEITRILLQRSLTLSGWVAIPVDDGGEIWPILEREDVTALVLDLNMPGVNGWEVLRRLRSDAGLREQRGHIRVVILSGQSDPGTREFALQLGADEFVAKPLDLEAINRVLNRT
jgi:CheY-like chemotaxis protein